MMGLNKIDESKKRAKQYLFMYLIDRKRKANEFKRSKWGNLMYAVNVSHTVPPRWYTGERNISHEYYEPLSMFFNIHISAWEECREEYFSFDDNGEIVQASTDEASHFFTDLEKYKFGSGRDYNYKKDKILEDLYNIIYKEIPDIEGLVSKPSDFREGLEESIYDYIAKIVISDKLKHINEVINDG